MQSKDIFSLIDKSILIVEDDPLSARSISISVEAMGLRVLAVLASGEDALRDAASLCPDLVLMDIQLKGPMDGIEAAWHIKKTCNIPVVFITAHATKEVLKRASTAEPYGYISKPISNIELKFTIEMAIHHHTLENRLRTAETRYRTLIDTIPHLIIEFDTEGKVTFFNRATLSFSGYSSEEAMGRWIGDLFTDPRLKRFINAILKKLIRNMPRPEHFTERLCFKNGVIRVMDIDWDYRYGEDGKPCGFIAIATDTTERSQTESMLRDSERRYRLISEILSDYAYSVRVGSDGSLVLEWETGSFQSITGKKLSDVIGQIQKPEGDGTGLSAMPEHLQHVLAGISFSSEFPVTDSAGSVRWIRQHSQPEWDRAAGRTIRFIVAGHDITERKRMEVALRESEEKFRKMTESNAAAIIVHRGDKFVDVNPAAVKLTGYSKEELLGMNFWDLVKPEYKNEIIQRALDREQGKSVPDHYEIPAIIKNGEVRWIDLTACVIEIGGVKSILATCYDITELRKMGESLRQSEEKYRLLFENANVGIVIVQDWKMKFSNPKTIELSGYNAEELNDKPFQEFIYPDDLPLVVDHHFRRTSGQDVETVYEFRFVPKSGPPKWVEIKTTSITWDAKPGILCFLSDISERRTAEEALAGERERLAVTLRSIGDGVIATDIDGRTVLINKAAEDLTSWTSDDAIGRPLIEVFPVIDEKTRLPRKNPVAEIIHKGGIIELDANSILIARDGSRRVISDSGAPIRDRNSTIVGVVIVFRDVTDKTRIEEELVKMSKLESIGILAGGIAHDFNNILTAILGNISLARAIGEGNSEMAEILTSAEKAALQAQNLTQQLLTFSRGGTLIKQAASIDDLVRDSVNFALRGSKVSCSFNFPPNLFPVDVDKGQIGQVLQNLIINADQSMPSGGVIEVSARNIEIPDDEILPLKDGHYVRLTITDNGTGIPPEHLKKIFDPFFTTKQKGSGLGLTIVYSVIKKHRGYINVKSELGSGTSFDIYLPSAHARAEKSEHPEKRSIHSGKGSILVMDDESVVRDTTGKMLAHMGYEVAFARSGEEAIEIYGAAMNEGRRFDAVIMDLTIPGGMGGREAAARLRVMDPDIRMIVSSGYSNDPIMSNFRAYGFSGMIVKPYSINDLGNTLNTLFASQ
jgi:PAS domain S-box-containing protein